MRAHEGDGGFCASSLEGGERELERDGGEFSTKDLCTRASASGSALIWN